MLTSFLRVTAFVGEILKEVVRPGDILIDATAGNGEDTLLLRKLTGENGKVYAFDVQAMALERTRKKLEDHHLCDGVVLIKESHEKMLETLKPLGVFYQEVKAIVFNLGYLPQGDHEWVTTSETTIKALEESLTLLCPKGVITVCLYSGHAQGKEESEMVLDWCKKLEAPFIAHHFQTLNRQSPPTSVIIQRMR